MLRPILTQKFLDQPLPAQLIEPTYRGSHRKYPAVNWRNLQRHLNLTLLPHNWDWILETSSILCATTHEATDHESGNKRPMLVVSACCTGTLAVHTSEGTLRRAGLGHGTGTQSLANQAGLDAYGIALHSADRAAFKRSSYLLGRFFGLDLGDRDVSYDQMIAAGSAEAFFPDFVSTQQPSAADIVRSPVLAQHPPPPPPPDETAAAAAPPQGSSHIQSLRASWNREHEQAESLPVAERYATQTGIDTRYSEALRQAGDPHPASRVPPAHAA